MIICPNCKNQLEDGAAFCPVCGLQLSASQQPPQGFNAPPVYTPGYDPFDHTADFDPKDISENKVFAMLSYLIGVVGIIIALLASSESPYTKYHIRQSLKFTVVETLTVLIIGILFWTIIVPVVGGIFLCVLGVIKIICFFQVCSGKAKEPAIIRSMNFLK